MTSPLELLGRFWGMHGAAVTPLGGGMNSETWSVEHEGSRYVAKRVSSTHVAGLETGCEIASMLAQAGLVTGRPVPTADGRLVVAEHRLALFEHVPGRELEGRRVEEQRWMASTLAAVHLAGGTSTGSSVATFMTDWLTPELAGVDPHPWLRSAIEAARAETDPLSVTWSVVHTDPAPEAFRHDDGTGVTGLIDWAGARHGPVLYDIASAVMYLGGPRQSEVFLNAYRAHGPLGDEELGLLEVFRRFRWAVQGAYFAWRLASDDLTGIVDRAENEKGLEDARRGLAGLGHDTTASA